MIKATAAVIAAILLAVALGIASWQLDWFVAEKNTNRQSRINNDSYARQTALQQEVLDTYNDVKRIDVQLTSADADSAQAIKAQRIALVEKLCNAYAQTKTVTLGANVQAFAAQEC